MQNFFYYTMMIFISSLFAQKAIESKPLTLIADKIIAVDYPGEIEPSGLTIWNNRLLTVHDKNDHCIFEIKRKDKSAILVPFLQFQKPAGRTFMPDFEGITSNDDKFYLASEIYCDLLEVSLDGKARWMNLPLLEYGKKRKFFFKPNARIEGVVFTKENQFIMAAEREPRGLASVKISPATVEGLQKIDGPSIADDIPADFAGLCYDNGTIWAIVRNSHQIVEIQGSVGKYKMGRRYSFAHILLHRDYRYSDMKYGIAEGIAADDKFFYIVVDNNNMARANNDRDKRPLLLILKKP